MKRIALFLALASAFLTGCNKQGSDDGSKWIDPEAKYVDVENLFRITGKEAQVAKATIPGSVVSEEDASATTSDGNVNITIMTCNQSTPAGLFIAKYVFTEGVLSAINIVSQEFGSLEEGAKHLRIISDEANAFGQSGFFLTPVAYNAMIISHTPSADDVKSFREDRDGYWAYLDKDFAEYVAANKQATEIYASEAFQETYRPIGSDGVLRTLILKLERSGKNGSKIVVNMMGVDGV